MVKRFRFTAPAGYGLPVNLGWLHPARISAFARWVVRTPWPVFTLGMLQADIIGALFVLGFLRFGLPGEDRVQLQDLPATNLAVFLIYLPTLVALVASGAPVSYTHLTLPTKRIV